MSEEEKLSVAGELKTAASIPQEAILKWDDSKMQTTYANVVNVTSTREEVSLFFGTNQSWKLGQDKQLIVQLSGRVVLNPYAAKRLSLLVTGVLQEYERRFGALPLD
jgi:hypothetical protein